MHKPTLENVVGSIEESNSAGRRDAQDNPRRTRPGQDANRAKSDARRRGGARQCDDQAQRGAKGTGRDSRAWTACPTRRSGGQAAQGLRGTLIAVACAPGLLTTEAQAQSEVNLVSNTAGPTQSTGWQMYALRFTTGPSEHWREGEGPPTMLHHCYHAGIGLDNCTHDEDVHLSCTGGTNGTPPQARAELTGQLEDVPAEHDGATPFTIRLSLTAPIESTAADLRDNAIEVIGGTLKSVLAVDGRADLWALGIGPDGNAEISVTVQGGGTCGEPGVLCTSDGTVLAETVSATVAGVPLGAGAANEDTEEALDALARWVDQSPLEAETRKVTGRDLLTGSTFSLTAGGGEPGAGVGSLWGRGSISSFSGVEDELTLDGEVASAILGGDFSQGRWTAGAMVAHSIGDGSYREGEQRGNGQARGRARPDHPVVTATPVAVMVGIARLVFGAATPMPGCPR